MFLDLSEEKASPEAGPSTAAAGEPPASPALSEAKPVERSVEFRSSDDSMASMVRCLYFADTFIVNGKSLKHRNIVSLKIYISLMIFKMFEE